MMNKIKFLLLFILAVPHAILYLLSNNKKTIEYEVSRWSNIMSTPYRKMGGVIRLMYLVCTTPEFRNLFYLRLGPINVVLRYLPRESTLHITTDSRKIEPGLFIQHGFATVVTADHIGRDCWINQCVTIGWNDSKTKGLGKPCIGDNVRVSAGAKVCGPINVGSNSTIGVNAVVVKNVPSNSVIIPSPMMILYQNNERVNKIL